MRTSALFVEKLRIFRNLWCVRTDKEGGTLSQCGHFSDKGRGVHVHVFMNGPLPLRAIHKTRFCADVFYEWPLTVKNFQANILHNCSEKFSAFFTIKFLPIRQSLSPMKRTSFQPISRQNNKPWRIKLIFGVLVLFLNRPWLLFKTETKLLRDSCIFSLEPVSLNQSRFHSNIFCYGNAVDSELSSNDAEHSWHFSKTKYVFDSSIIFQ